MWDRPFPHPCQLNGKNDSAATKPGHNRQEPAAWQEAPSICPGNTPLSWENALTQASPPIREARTGSGTLYATSKPAVRQFFVNTALEGFGRSCRTRRVLGNDAMQSAITSTQGKTGKVCIFKDFRMISDVTPLTRNHPRGIVRSWLAQAADQWGAARQVTFLSVECSIWGR